jgi:hypothetical protein
MTELMLEDLALAAYLPGRHNDVPAERNRPRVEMVNDRSKQRVRRFRIRPDLHH